MKKIVGSTLDLSTKSRFLIGQVPIEKIWAEHSVFAIQHIENRKSFTEVLYPRDQTNPFAYSCSFTFHTSYKNGMIGHGGGGGGGRCQNAQKHFTIKKYSKLIL